MPNSSNCSGLSIPRRKNTRSNTKPTDAIPPKIMPANKTITSLGFTGLGWETALSIILTLPIALDLAILSSC